MGETLLETLTSKRDMLRSVVEESSRRIVAARESLEAYEEYHAALLRQWKAFSDASEAERNPVESQ